MIVTNRTKEFLLILSLFGSMPYLMANTNTGMADIPQISLVDQKALADHLESAWKLILDAYATLDARFEELSDITSKGKITTKNKLAVLTEIRAERELIQAIQKQAYVHTDPASIKISIMILKALVIHLNKALANKFYELPHFDITQITALRSPSAFTLSNLEQELETVTTLMAQLDENSKTAGLQWYNKFFRKIEDSWGGVSKQNIPLYTMLGTAAAATAFYWLLYKSDKESYELPFLNWDWQFRDKHFPWCGWEYPDRMFFGGDALEERLKDNPVQWLGQFEHWVDQSKQGKTAVGLALFGLTSALTYLAWDDIKLWSRKKMATGYNFLRGGATNLKEPEEEGKTEPRFTFKDLIGLDHIKNELSVFVKYLEDPERFDRRDLMPEKGILFIGDTRTGKSFMAECLAGEIKEMLKKHGRAEEVGFHVISADFINRKGIAYILELAKKEAPCILFIDEIDLLRLQRDRDANLLSEFLSVMSGCFDGNAKKMVILIAATNKPSNMDDALRQHGRFSKIYHFDYPNAAERKLAITKKLETLSIDPMHFDIEKITRETEKRSFKDIDVMLTEALRTANLRGEILTQELIEESLDAEVRKVVDTDTDMVLSTQEQELISAHLAGQVLAHILTQSQEKLTKVTIKKLLPRLREDAVNDKYYWQAQQMIEFGKIFTYRERDHFNFDTQQAKINQCKILLAGNIAENILLGSCSYSYHPEEKQQALNILKAIVYEGVRPEDLSKNINNKLIDETCKRLSAIESEIAAALSSHKDAIAALAKALREKQTLTYADIVETLAPYGIAQPVRETPANVPVVAAQAA